MIEFTAGTLEAKLIGLNKVLHVDGLDNRANYGFCRMAPAIQAEYQSFEQARMDLIAKHAQRDEAGNKTTSDGQYVMTDPEAYQTEYEQLAAQTISVNVQPVLASLIIASEGCVTGAIMLQLAELIRDDVGAEPVPVLQIVDAEEI